MYHTLADTNKEDFGNIAVYKVKYEEDIGNIAVYKVN